MSDMPGPNETRLNLIDGVEYITLRADDFRAEVERLHRDNRVLMESHAEARDQLRAEIEQLKDEVLDAHLRCVYEVRESQAEVEQLRAALTRLRAALEPNAGRDSLSLREAREITEQALAHHKE